MKNSISQTPSININKKKENWDKDNFLNQKFNFQGKKGVGYERKKEKEEKKKKKKSHLNLEQCFECGKQCHLKSECPIYIRKQVGEKKRKKDRKQKKRPT